MRDNKNKIKRIAAVVISITMIFGTVVYAENTDFQNGDVIGDNLDSDTDKINFFDEFSTLNDESTLDDDFNNGDHDDFDDLFGSDVETTLETVTTETEIETTSAAVTSTTEVTTAVTTIHTTAVTTAYTTTTPLITTDTTSGTDINWDDLFGPGTGGGELTISRLIQYKKYLLNIKIGNFNNADIVKDGKINIFDYAVLKKNFLLNKERNVTGTETLEDGGIQTDDNWGRLY